MKEREDDTPEVLPWVSRPGRSATEADADSGIPTATDEGVDDDAAVTALRKVPRMQAEADDRWLDSGVVDHRSQEEQYLHLHSLQLYRHALLQLLLLRGNSQERSIPSVERMAVVGDDDGERTAVAAAAAAVDPLKERTRRPAAAAAVVDPPTAVGIPPAGRVVDSRDICRRLQSD